MYRYDISEFLISEGCDQGKELTSRKLHTLLYYSQGLSLIQDDIPLFEEDFQAWYNGPVLPSQYRLFSPTSPNATIKFCKKPNIDDSISNILKRIVIFFGDRSDETLENLFIDDGPWKDARKDVKLGENSKNVIKKSYIKDFFDCLDTYYLKFVTG